MTTLRQRFLTGLLLLAFLFSGAAFSILNGQGVTPDITVALDGSGDFTKIQDAINAVPDNSPTPTLIFIKRGLYNTEKLIVPATKARIVLIGESRDETIISYHVYDCSAGGYENKCPAEDAKKWPGDNIRTSATLTVIADDFRAENLTIQNTAGPVGQALALTLRGDRAIFRNCNFSSYQDTKRSTRSAGRTNGICPMRIRAPICICTNTKTRGRAPIGAGGRNGRGFVR
ncbi:MAG: hypothetical protein IPH16_09300 [Haliscomenobacter sp.]|nr:hypothetical protein [Haliscomenobacter sp.]